MVIKQTDSRDSRINRMPEDLYDHFLREAGDCTDPEQWYEDAVTVADRFKELVLQSRERNIPWLQGKPRKQVH